MVINKLIKTIYFKLIINIVDILSFIKTILSMII